MDTAELVRKVELARHGHMPLDASGPSVSKKVIEALEQVHELRTELESAKKARDEYEAQLSELRNDNDHLRRELHELYDAMEGRQ